jgi:hypothetical protein
MNEEQALQYLVNRGFAPHQAAGILGNLAQESGLNPNAVGDGGAAYGLAQWRGPRRTALINYARQNRRNPNAMDTQLDFLVDELQGTEKRALDSLVSAKTPQEAAIAFSRDYERPGKPNNERRVGLAQRFMNAVVPGAEAGELPPLPEGFEEIADAPAQARGADNLPPLPDGFEEVSEQEAMQITPESSQESGGSGMLDDPNVQTAIRSTVKGLSSPVTMFMDTANAPYNLLARGVNAIRPDTLPYAPSGREYVDAALRKAGVNPESQSIPEDIVTAGLSAASGAGAFGAVPSGAGAGARFAQSMAANPVKQVVGAGTAAASSDLAREAGLGPVGQAVAGAVGGIVGSGAAGTMQGIASGAKRAGQTMTTGGKEQIAGRILNRQATAPENTIARARNPALNREIIPGSRATLPEVSQDPGLARLQRVLTSSDKAIDAGVDQINAVRFTQMDKAIRNVLNNVNRIPKEGKPDALYLLDLHKRNVISQFDDGLASAGRDVATIPVKATRIENQIKSLKARYYGNDNIKKLLTRIEAKLAEEPPEGATKNSFRQVWNMRQELDDAIYEGWQQSSASTKQDLAKVGKMLRGSMNDALVDAEPSFEKFLRQYSRAQRAEDRLVLGRSLVTKMQNAGRTLADGDAVYGERVLSGAKTQNVVDQIEDFERRTGATLSPAQRKAFEAVQREKARADILTTGGAPINSATRQNFAVDQMIAEDIVGGLIGDKAGTSGLIRSIGENFLGRPLQLATKSAQPEILRLVAQGLMNPEEGARLMELGRLAQTPTLRGLIQDTGRTGLLSEFYRQLSR